MMTGSIDLLSVTKACLAVSPCIHTVFDSFSRKLKKSVSRFQVPVVSNGVNEAIDALNIRPCETCFGKSHLSRRIRNEGENNGSARYSIEK